MTLIRGLGSQFPCPVCLVPSEELARLSYDPPYDKRNAAQAKTIVTNSKLTKQQREEQLKGISMMDVYVSLLPHVWVDD